MAPIFYIGKRTLLDILRTALFWVTVFLALTLVFVILYIAWVNIKRDLVSQGLDPNRPMSEQFSERGGHLDPDDGFEPIEFMDPEKLMIQLAYSDTIGLANILAIFIMIGILSRDVDRKTIDMLLARPVSRGQIFLGKLAGGWAAIVVYLAIVSTWGIACQFMSGMEPDIKTYYSACVVGALQPLLLGAMTLTLSTWMRGSLAGLLTVVSMIASTNAGLWMIKMLGVEVLKLELPVRILFKIQPPLNVIGKFATDNFQKDISVVWVQAMFQDKAPSAADGLYTEMWHVWVYLGVVILLGWLSFFRRQFA